MIIKFEIGLQINKDVYRAFHTAYCQTIAVICGTVNNRYLRSNMSVFKQISYK